MNAIQTIFEPDCPLIKCLIIFPLGKMHEDKKLQSMLFSQMLMKGTENKNALEIHSILDFYGASMDCFSGPMHTNIEIYCHQKHWKHIVDLLFEVCYKAKFDVSEWDLLLKKKIEELKQLELQNDWLADKKIMTSLFGSEHNFGYIQTVSDYQNIDLEDIIRFYNEYWLNITPSFFIAGGIDASSLQYLENQWNSNKKQAVIESINSKITYSESEQNSNSKQYQVSIRLGKLFECKDEMEFLTYEVFNMALGGFFGSALMREIRQKKGLTYGIYSYLQMYANQGALIISLETAPSNLKIALDAILSIFDRYYKDKDLFNEAKRQVYSNWIRSSSQSLNEIKNYVRFHKMGFDYKKYASLVKQIESIDFDLTKNKFGFAKELEIVYL
jgi:predicted Zn-dependent peptidase